MHRASRDVHDRQARLRSPVPAEVVGDAHRAGRVAGHGMDAAVGRARADREDGGRLGRQPVEPLAGGDRLAGGGVVAEPAPVALFLERLVRDRALDDEHERLELAPVGLEPPLDERVGAFDRAALVVDERPVDRDLREAGQRAEHDLLDARLGRCGESDGVAVAAESCVDPEDVQVGCRRRRDGVRCHGVAPIGPRGALRHPSCSERRAVRDARTRTRQCRVDWAPSRFPPACAQTSSAINRESAGSESARPVTKSDAHHEAEAGGEHRDRGVDRETAAHWSTRPNVVIAATAVLESNSPTMNDASMQRPATGPDAPAAPTNTTTCVGVSAPTPCSAPMPSAPTRPGPANGSSGTGSTWRWRCRLAASCSAAGSVRLRPVPRGRRRPRRRRRPRCVWPWSDVVAVRMLVLDHDELLRAGAADRGRSIVRRASAGRR